MSIAFVFPGQGSQAPRMGLDWASSSETSGDLYGWASTCLGWDLTKMLESASPDELRQTYIAQPAIFAVSVAALRALRGEDRWLCDIGLAKLVGRGALEH